MDQGNTSGGLTFIGGLQLLLIGLKLTSTITWPWWQVLLPFTLDAVLTILALMALAAYNKYSR